ncbi:MAG: PadR family transcriptional regulator [Myxococcota bacterium]
MQPNLPTGTETEILRLLVERGESYGLALVKASNGKLKRGTVYVLLQRLEDKGLVLSRQEDSTPEYIGIPRRLYRATDVGGSVLRALDLAVAAVSGNFAT